MHHCDVSSAKLHCTGFNQWTRTSFSLLSKTIKKTTFESRIKRPTNRKTLKEFNMKDLVLLLVSRGVRYRHQLLYRLGKVMARYNHHSSNDPQISVTSEVIEQVATETQISPEDLEVWCRGMDKEENVCLEMSDEDIIKEVSNNTTNDQEDNDDVIATAPQVTDQDAVNAFELGLQWAEENGTSYNELYF
ncbi:hypothetical protein JTB14_024247 [Gonioctena quinquepunctata]|nr:hypothetical protein JTB14_024247 [Gonioctena quinquepunctata]